MSPFIFIIALFQIIVFLGHLLLYKTLVRFLGLPGTAALKTVLAVLSVSFISASVLTFKKSGALVHVFYTLSACWLGVFHFLFWSCILCWSAWWAHKAAGVRFDSVPWAATLLILGLVTGIYGIVNAGDIRIKKIGVSLPSQAEDSASAQSDLWADPWKGKSAVFISDLHLGPVRNLGFAREVAAKIKEIGPDILFIGGDFYDGTSTTHAEDLIKPFAEINPPLGAYFITGNHEEFSARAKKKYVQAVREAGIKVLGNQLVEVDGLQIAGVDYMDTFTRSQYENVLKAMNFNRAEPVLLLKHSPMYPDVSQKEGVTFEICGHTHKGQIFPVNLITHYVYNGFDGGLKKLGALTVYTSTGVGTWGPPLRAGNRPEIVLIRFL